jgi:hypothetical protein
MTIYSYLQGGLGNQMFQYAIARALSEHYRTQFALNRYWFNAHQGDATPRELQLDVLNIQEVPILDSTFPQKPKRWQRVLQHFFTKNSLVIYQDNAFDFDQDVFHLKNAASRNIYLAGYWQAYAYIDAIKEILKGEFKTKAPLFHFYQTYLDQIQSQESVMVHIRRGDYVHSKAASQFHGVLPLQYYEQAIHALQNTKPNLQFFIFSDDLQWAKDSLQGNFQKTFIEHAPHADAVAHELQLMRACDHHIIANSSLSWWGAWLKKNPHGLVYAPNHWINDDTLNLSALLPPDWIRIPC